MITILATIFVFGLLVFVHELGHFVIAKLSGMKVTEFAIGFGPGIYKKQEGETLYSLRAIPLGGYNKIAGMDPDDEEDPRNFDNQSLIKRILVVLAGSTMNLLLPIVLFFIIIMTSGLQKPVDLPQFGKIIENTPAATAGLKENDKVVSVDGKKVGTWSELVDNIKDKSNQQIKLVVERDGQNLNLVVIPQYDAKAKKSVIGVIAKTTTYKPGVIEAMQLSVTQTYMICKEMITSFYYLIFDRSQPADLAGPIGVAQMAGKVAQYGIIPLLNFAALLSINLGIINLLPLPLLDGGHIVVLMLEGIRGKKLGANTMQKIQYVGMILLFSLLIFATFKDVIRLSS